MLTLKEVFMREDGPQDSKFVSSMRKQFGRAQDQPALDYISGVYDRILELASNPEQAQAVLAAEDGFFKFHYRIAYQEIQKGTLNATAAPSGQEIVESELEKRRAAQASAQAGQAAKPALTPADQAAAHKRSVYGGDPNDPRGLGT